MYQSNPAFKIPNTFVLDRNRERKVVFYGRVSTEHEEQLAALGNQMQWYEDQARFHPNWTVLDKYIDEEHSYPALFSVQINEKVAGVAPAEYRKMTVN